MEQGTKSLKTFTIWSAYNRGPMFTIVSTPATGNDQLDLRRAVSDAGLCSSWIYGGVEPTQPIPGVFDMGDDAAFDHDSPQAMAELGSSIVNYLHEAAADGCNGLVLR